MGNFVNMQEKGKLQGKLKHEHLLLFTFQYFLSPHDNQL